MAKKKKLSASELKMKKMAKLAMAKFATKEEVAAIAGADLTLADDEDADAVWDGYTFSTTD